MLFNLTVLLFLLKRMRLHLPSIYSVLIMGVISLSLFAGTAYAQDIAGLPVLTDTSELFLGLMETNLVWIIPTAVAGVVILKIKSKK